MKFIYDSFKIKQKLIIASFLIMGTVGCKKFEDTDAPYWSINAGNIYTKDATAASVLTGIYAQLSVSNSRDFNSSGFSSVSLFTSLSSDELTLYDLSNLVYIDYYRNSLLSNPTAGTADFWSAIYPIIYSSNAALDGLNKSVQLTPAIKQELIGEAKFVRAFCYLYLVNLFGDVPLITTTDWKSNAAFIRSEKKDVYALIIDDLKDAETLLSDNFLMSDASTPYPSGSEERVRPTKWAAIALLSRVYLYVGDWGNAENEATKVINKTPLFKLETLANAFLKNNNEAIWQLQAVGSGKNSNTGEGKRFVLPSSGPSTTYPIYLSDNVVSSFEPGDQRKSNWVGAVNVGTTTYYYPFKYKIGAVNTQTQEYCTVLRLAEVYLIRAEARTQLNNISGAQADLNMIRSRAGLNNTTAGDKTSLFSAITQERKVEFFTEWGHRWFDLKRTNNIDIVMGIVATKKGGTWQSSDQLYPIPQTELFAAPQLIQNPGY